jgi:hypothetical protein
MDAMDAPQKSKRLIIWNEESTTEADINKK